MSDLRQEIELKRDEDFQPAVEKFMAELIAGDTTSELHGFASGWIAHRSLSRRSPKTGEWQGRWICHDCGMDFTFGPDHGAHYHAGGSECTGTLVPYERRKGGAK
jgi:hypothetical protein